VSAHEEERELASASGLQNFLRTLSGAVATSIVTTAWEDKTSFVHAEFAGFVDRSGDMSISLGNLGMSVDAVRSTLDHLLQGQSVMVATNQLMAAVAIICGISGFMIWLAPKPMRAIDLTKAGH
jgi:DHA2 family multidrug resistance protein